MKLPDSMRHKINIILILSFVISFPLMSQKKLMGYQIKGQVIEKHSSKSIPYATITIKNDSTQKKIMQASDASGRFLIKIGEIHKYTLIISSVGYKEIHIPLNIKKELTDLGTLSMEEGVELKTVTITAQKPLVKETVDKIVYSVESDPESQTSNTLEILRKVPLITVDGNDEIYLKGQQSFKILVNGKSSLMMTNNTKDVLKNLPASKIKNIEIITNPSSKYDAEGVGGIINIITSRKIMSGYNGSINSRMDSHGSLNSSIYLTTKINKFCFSSYYSAMQNKAPSQETNSTGEYYNNTDYHYLNSTSNNRNLEILAQNFTVEASYEIDSLNLISCSIWQNNGSINNDFFGENKYFNTDRDITRWYQNKTKGKSTFNEFSGNIDYQKLYKKPDKSLTFSYEYNSYPHTYLTTANIEGLTNYPTYNQRSTNNLITREQTLQADYCDPLTEKHQIEGGMKFILRQNTSNSDIYRDDTLRINNSDNLDYDQSILGAYASYVFKLKKLNVMSGLRLEYVWNNGESKFNGKNYNFINKLNNLVPYITFAYKPKDGQLVKISYTQRLSRPSIRYLNPFVINDDSMNIRYGNPSLNAEVAHSFELGYNIFTAKFNFSVSSYAFLINNSIESISKIQSNGIKVTTFDNIGKNQSYGLSLYTSYRAGMKFNIYFDGNADYKKFEGNKGYTINSEGFSYSGSLGGQITLWKNGRFNANGGIYSPAVRFQGKSSSYFYTSLGLSQYLLKHKLSLSLSVSDPFWYKKTKTNESKDKTFYIRNQITSVAQTLHFDITYYFGKTNFDVKKVKHGINNDDLKQQQQ